MIIGFCWKILCLFEWKMWWGLEQEVEILLLFVVGFEDREKEIRLWFWRRLFYRMWENCKLFKNFLIKWILFIYLSVKKRFFFTLSFVFLDNRKRRTKQCEVFLFVVVLLGFVCINKNINDIFYLNIILKKYNMWKLIVIIIVLI